MMLMTDDRFEIINRAKEALLDSTNIEQSPDEMKVLNDFLFRCWQMGWLDRYTRWIPCSEKLPENIKTVLVTVEEIECPTIGWYGSMDGWRLHDKEFCELKGFNVIAWMPLPPAFKGETE